MQNDTPSLEDVKAHFDHWRAIRPKRCKIPSSLWDKVKPIIGHYSMTNITKALGVNSGQIKQHVQPGDDIQFLDVSDSILPFLSKPDLVSNDQDQNKILTISVEMRRVTGDSLKINALPLASLRELVMQFIG